jgi:hypothetical protein
MTMKKPNDIKKTDKGLSLKTATIKNMNLLSEVKGGMMNMNPRTDCICCKACATNAC